MVGILATLPLDALKARYPSITEEEILMHGHTLPKPPNYAHLLLERHLGANDLAWGFFKDKQPPVGGSRHADQKDIDDFNSFSSFTSSLNSNNQSLLASASSSASSVGPQLAALRMQTSEIAARFDQCSIISNDSNAAGEVTSTRSTSLDKAADAVKDAALATEPETTGVAVKHAEIDSLPDANNRSAHETVSDEEDYSDMPALGDLCILCRQRQATVAPLQCGHDALCTECNRIIQSVALADGSACAACQRTNNLGSHVK